MSKYFDRFLKFLGKKPTHEVKQEIESFVNSAKAYVDEYQSRVAEVYKQRKLLELMAHHLGGLVWIKRWDAEQKIYIYEFANRTHCDKFFRFEPECLEDCTAHVAGKSDVDILNEYRERTQNKHSFGDLCVSTDVHSTMQAILHYDTHGAQGFTSCRYIECGYIGEQPFVLEVVKTPLFDPQCPCKCWASHTHTVGNAFDVTESCESRIAFAQRCVENGQGVRLQSGVFWIYPERGACDLLEQELPR